MLKQLLQIVLVLTSPLWISLIFLLISFVVHHAWHFCEGHRVKGKSISIKRHGFFKRVFIDFPKRLSLDIYNRDPAEFKEYGLHMFCGEQGSGKTTAIVHKLLQLKERYPKSRIRTNMCYSSEDAQITHWEELVANDNGIYGQVEVLDEIQTWFSSNQSKNFPPEMITEVSQQRKQRKMLIGSAQVFSRIAKPIREQTSFVYLPLTLFGCFTIVRVSKPQYWDDEKQTFKRYIKMYFFVHSDEIRNAFDTYKKIEKYKKSGFNENSVLRQQIV